MGKTDRVYRIERLIRDRGCVSFAEMLRELEVSPATLKRDLEYLRSRLDVPVVYDRFDNGYKYDPQSSGPGRAQRELPGIWFTDGEIYALLTMYQLILELDEGGMLARHMQPMLEKLRGMLGTNRREADELMKRVRIVTPARRPVRSQIFELVGSALLKRRRIEMTYYTRARRVESDRAVSPQRLVHYRNTWYLDAWCHANNGLRRFSLDAIRDGALLSQRALEVPIKTVESELDGGYGIFAGAKQRSQWATLHFAPEAAQWVQHEQWHPAQEASLHDDQSLTLRVPYSDATELAMDVLRHGEQVKVLAPAALAELVARRLRAAARIYAGGKQPDHESA